MCLKFFIDSRDPDLGNQGLWFEPDFCWTLYRVRTHGFELVTVRSWVPTISVQPSLGSNPKRFKPARFEPNPGSNPNRRGSNPKRFKPFVEPEWVQTLTVWVRTSKIILIKLFLFESNPKFFLINIFNINF